MYIWQKAVTSDWLRKRGESLGQQFGPRLALVERRECRRTSLEISCQTIRETRALVREFGGKVVKLRHNWLQRFATKASAAPPLRIGSRLIVRRTPSRSSARSIIIPAEAAFGTGEHATTAMCLRLLERVTRSFDPGWKMLDAGTGSGILAIAGSCFGAGRVFAIDTDPLAAVTAMRNARINCLANVEVSTGDILTKRMDGTFKLITANLYSEILIGALPIWTRHLAVDGRLILSGILLSQQSTVIRALRRNRLHPLKISRRGKWVAVLAGREKEKGS